MSRPGRLDKTPEEHDNKTTCAPNGRGTCGKTGRSQTNGAAARESCVCVCAQHTAGGPPSHSGCLRPPCQSAIRTQFARSLADVRRIHGLAPTPAITQIGPIWGSPSSKLKSEHKCSAKRNGLGLFWHSRAFASSPEDRPLCASSPSSTWPEPKQNSALNELLWCGVRWRQVRSRDSARLATECRCRRG